MDIVRCTRCHQRVPKQDTTEGRCSGTAKKWCDREYSRYLRDRRATPTERHTVTRIVYLLAALGLLAGGGAVATAHAGNHPDNVTLCHASGQAGTTKYETLTVGYEAAYGPAGHFDENGTPNAGHEQDYLGPCEEPPPPPHDFCDTLPGVQAEDEDCPPPPPVDVCPNLEGVQENVPPGMGIVDGECVPVGINPLCAPPAVLVNGQCIVPPPPPVNPPNVTGNPDVFCDLGAQLYRVRGTVDGQPADSANPPTIPGNTRGFTNIVLVRGDTHFRTVVFTYGDCSLSPPVITTPPVVTPPVVTPTPPTVITKVITKTKIKTKVVIRYRTRIVHKTVIKRIPGKCPKGTRAYKGSCHAVIEGSG